MTPETPNWHVSKNLNISKTKQDIEKLKTPLRLVWKCCSVVFKIGSKIFSLQWHFKSSTLRVIYRKYAKGVLQQNLREEIFVVLVSAWRIVSLEIQL